MSKTPESKFEYASEAELINQFNTYMKDPKNVEEGTNYLYDSLVDEVILGLVFEMHHAIKSGSAALVLEKSSNHQDTAQYTIVDAPDVDVFGSSNTKKAIDCTCPNCDRLVACSRFAPHLEKCMGKNTNIELVAKSHC
jgi:SAGA-associated factor 11